MSVRKRALIAGAAIAAVGMATVGSVGLVSAATTTNGTDNGSSSLVDKLVAKFNLNKADVQAVVDADRADHKAEMQAQQKERLAQAVTDGKLTQEQADYITKAQAEIEALMGDAKPGDQSDTVRDQIKTKMDALRKWATDNKVDMQYVGHGGHGGPGGRGGFGRGGANGQTDDKSDPNGNDSSTDSSDDNGSADSSSSN